MSYAIVFSSRTGNTALLAQTIRDTLPGDCLYLVPQTPKHSKQKLSMSVSGPIKEAAMKASPSS